MSEQDAFRAGLNAAAEYLIACDDHGDRHKAEEIRNLPVPASPQADALPAIGDAHEHASSDARLLGAGYLRVNPDGSLDRLEPSSISFAAPASVRVKPLVWGEIRTHGGEALSASFGEWSSRIYLRGAPFRDRDAWIEREKAKAQAEFDSFILSAIASDASPRGEAVACSHCGGAGESPDGCLCRGCGGGGRVYAHPAPATVEMRELRDLEDAILACERGTMSDVLANYRTVRRTIQVTRAALAPATEGRKG